ncbi:SHOCT domain-containing protein [Chitinophaga sp. Hz27]|uniref:SHOCT domain-containing protein n=1 Tax=Chitinophaga sp. Hz27 TaxID=3347169 RepID=UPI0035DB4A31
MKRNLFFVCCCSMIAVAGYAQDGGSLLPKIENDTLFTTSGFTLARGQEVKMGVGSMPDGDFKFIRVNAASFFAYHSTSGYQGLANQANALPRSQSGLVFKIKAIEARGDRKHGYVYYAKFGWAMRNYEIDVENAIATGELTVPDEYKPKGKGLTATVDNKPAVSVADELTKLKKLLDDGVLTQEEYNQQKKKLLGNN